MAAGANTAVSSPRRIAASRAESIQPLPQLDRRDAPVRSGPSGKREAIPFATLDNSIALGLAILLLADPRLVA